MTDQSETTDLDTVKDAAAVLSAFIGQAGGWTNDHERAYQVLLQGALRDAERSDAAS